MREKILVVEKDKGTSSFLKALLTGDGYEVTLVESGLEWISGITSHSPDIILLSPELAGAETVNLIEAVRSRSSQPLLILSAKNLERDRVEALESGADDYIVKPFSPAELLARVHVATRHLRALRQEQTANRFICGPFEIDFDRHTAKVSGRDCHLTQTEFRIVSLLCHNAGSVVTHEAIMKELWGPESLGNNQILRVNMANIRRKIEENPTAPKILLTEVGVGYRIADRNPAEASDTESHT